MMVAIGISEFMHVIRIVITSISVAQTSMLFIVVDTVGELMAEEVGTMVVLSVYSGRYPFTNSGDTRSLRR